MNPEKYEYERVLLDIPPVQEQIKNHFRNQGRNTVLGILSCIGLLLLGLLIALA